MTVRVIDIETTGIDAVTDAIVEVASVDLTHEKTITNRQETLVRPGIPVPPEASAIHHLVDQDLVSAPQLAEVIDRFKGADAYVAHNCSFERSFLDRHFGEVQWICTYKCALRIWPELVTHGNQSLRYHLGLVKPFGIDRATLTPHRALSDVIVTAAILVEMLARARWSELARWSDEPALMTVFAFDKYRGQRFDAVPEDYLRWIAEGSNELRDEVKFSARHWLRQRTG